MTRRRDNLTQAGAQELAERLNAYWSERGVEINARPVNLGTVEDGGKNVWAVRSDLVGGARVVSS